MLSDNWVLAVVQLVVAFFVFEFIVATTFSVIFNSYYYTKRNYEKTFIKQYVDTLIARNKEAAEEKVTSMSKGGYQPKATRGRIRKPPKKE